VPSPCPSCLLAASPGTEFARGGEYRVAPMHDQAYFEDLAGRLYGLVIIFSDRLPAAPRAVIGDPFG
jgi:hypothetical protein